MALLSYSIFKLPAYDNFHLLFFYPLTRRTIDPDDQTGGMILLMLPQVVIHEIDETSPFLAQAGTEISSMNIRERVVKNLAESHLEIVAIVEGTDTISGGAVQARHSYLARDILWDHNFSSCVSKGADGFAVINFDVFHSTFPVQNELLRCSS
jgi:hypothetical protein